MACRQLSVNPLPQSKLIHFQLELLENFGENTFEVKEPQLMQKHLDKLCAVDFSHNTIVCP